MPPESALHQLATCSRPSARSAMILLLILVLSAYQVGRITFGPDGAVRRPVVTITTECRGLDSASVERDITIPMEAAVCDLPGITRIESSSELHRSRVTLTLQSNSSPDALYGILSERVEGARRRLPRGAQPPVISSGSGTTPVMIIAFPAPQDDLSQLRERVDGELKMRFEALPGAGRIEIGGGSPEELLVTPELKRCAAGGIPLSHIARRIAAETRPLSVGSLQCSGMRLPVALPGPPDDSAELGSLDLFPAPGAPAIPLEAVAEVRERCSRRSSVSRINGKESVILYLYMAGEGSLLPLSRNARALCRRIEEGGTAVQLLYDAGMEIERGIRNLARAAAAGLLAVSLVCAAALRSARLMLLLFLPAVGLISLALLSRLLPAVGTHVLSGLAVGFGLAADSALIAASLRRRQPDRRASAYLPPLLAATLTSVAVLLPLLGTDNISAEARGLALALVTVLSVSCAGAAGMLTMLPQAPPLPARTGRSSRIQAGGSALLLRMVRALIRRRRLLLLLQVLLFLVCLGVLCWARKDFSRESSDGVLFGRIDFPSGTAMEAVDRMTSSCTARLARIPGVELTESRARREAAGFSLHFDPGVISETHLRRRVRQCHTGRKGLLHLYGSTPEDKRLAVHLLGDDHRQLEKSARSAARGLLDRTWVERTVLHFKEPPPALVFKMDRRRASARCVSLSALVSTLRCQLQGAVCGKRLIDGREADIRIKAGDAEHAIRTALPEIPVLSAGGTAVSLGTLGTFREERIPGPIRRIDRSRAASFTLYCNSDLTWAEIERKVHSFFGRDMQLPRGYMYRLDDRIAERKASIRKLRRTALLAAGLVYCILAAAGESFGLPLLVLGAAAPALLPSALLPVILRGALDTAALSGLIVAGGLAVNNTILAVDALRARAPDFSLQPAEARCRAIAGALSQRLETLVLTTSSTLAGSIPLFLFNGHSGSFAATLAAAVCSGVAGSLAAALLFLPPLFYALPRLCRASFSSPFAPSRLESESNHY